MGKAIERKECMECKREFKCCASSSIDMTISEAARILEYLDKSTCRFGDYFEIKTNYKGEFDGLYAKRKIVRKDEHGYDVGCCIFFDVKKRLCTIHEVKPSLCATHVCCDIYHDWSDEEFEKLRALRRKKGLDNYSGIRFKEECIINEYIIRDCLKHQRETKLEQQQELINACEEFHYKIKDILNLWDDYDD